MSVATGLDDGIFESIKGLSLSPTQITNSPVAVFCEETLRRFARFDTKNDSRFVQIKNILPDLRCSRVAGICSGRGTVGIIRPDLFFRESPCYINLADHCNNQS